jgi:hypothetical protein
VKKLAFDFTVKDFESIYNTTKCDYCGDHISTIGLDRLNNDLGYTKDNVVPCCSTCNLMRKSMSVNDFESKILQIARYIKMRYKTSNSKVNNVIFSNINIGSLMEDK